MPTLDEVLPTLPNVARRAIAAALHGELVRPASPAHAPSFGVFVTLRSADGALRGCVGALTPLEPDVIRETERAAVLAASGDPRFLPVGAAELEELSIEVSVVMPEEPVTGPSELDPSRYGVVVRDQSGRRGVLLPDVPGVSDAQEQISIACRKAGIPAGRQVMLARFAVRKFGDRVGAVGIEPTTSSV